MTQNGPEVDNGTNLIQNHSGKMLVAFGAMILICFGVWLITAAFPAGDKQRERIAVALDNGRTLIVDYPKRILADDSTGVVQLTVDSLESMRVVIGLPQDVPLILSSVVPSTTLLTNNGAAGQLIIDWPTPTPLLATPSSSNSNTSSNAQQTLVSTPAVTQTTTPDAASMPTPIGIIPVTTQPHTISLRFANAGSQRSRLSFLPFLWGFADTSFKIVNSSNKQQIPLQVETTDRANWRAFAKEYSFIVILPTIIAAIAFLYKTYSEQQAGQRQQAKEFLDRFKQAASEASSEDIERQWARLQEFSTRLATDDYDRARQVYQFSQGSAETIAGASSFTMWTDSWAGALIVRAEKSKQLNQEFPFRYIRTFPSDQLSPTVEQRFRKFITEHALPEPQLHEWPMPAKSPEGYSTASPKSIADVRLFPVSTADNSEERSYLFSKEAQWFWREHLVHSTIGLSSKSILVCGEAGCGRTALALALTRYATVDEGVLGTYHTQPASLSEAQRSLAQELLCFVRWRSTRLTKLTQEDRNLLATVFSNVLDARYVLSALSTPEPTQFSSTDINKEIWEKQALVEFRLLTQSFGQMEGKHTLPPPQWFAALSRCAKKMDFQQLRIALDLTIEQYEPWRTAHLWQFLSALPSDSEAPVQLIVLVPGQAGDFDVRSVGMDIQELKWQNDPNGGEPPLVLMLRHRLMQRIKESNEASIMEFVPKQAQNVLCEAARYNPRRLALLWQHIAREHPDAKRVTLEIIQDAEIANP